MQEIADRVGASTGIEVVEVEWLGAGNSRLLRIYIDKPEGVSHGDCERISTEVGTILDVEGVIPASHYRLEVSSPGVERKLTRPHDYEHFAGRKIKVNFKAPVENQKHWEGTLRGYSGGVATLEVASDRSIRFSLDQVSKANLKFEW